MADLFLSYSTSDHETAEQIADRLEHNHVSVYSFERNGAPGVPYSDEIRGEISKCKGIFILLSKSALKSEWVALESTTAWALNKRIFPILLGIAPGALPRRLRPWRATPIRDIDRAIKEFLSIQPAPVPKTRALIFDIDGTVLRETESFDDRQKTVVLDVLERLSSRGFRLIFITGNDYRKQHPRILGPLVKRGLADSVFCFTDGGSRAFEFDLRARGFVEITKYSRSNLIEDNAKQHVLEEFNLALKDYLLANETLRIPEIVPYRRTLDYLDHAIRPIRPSFFKSDIFPRFCDDILACCHRPVFARTAFELITDIAYVLVIRAHGRTPQVDDDQQLLTSIILGELLLNPDYKDISKPEAEVRGGEVTCQIALKPFKDHGRRREFRHIMDDRLNKKGQEAKFGVLIGGRTTVDVLRRDVDKSRALRFVTDHLKLDPSATVYFGDEFGPFGNDLPVALMPDGERPAVIVNVGDTNTTEPKVQDRMILDGNGPAGTMNYLRILDFETSHTARAAAATA